MYCPNCGVAEQHPNSYCRKCGEFLIDVSDKFNSVFKFFGINTPEKQINLNLVFDFVSVVFSLILLVFLIGYVQANSDKNPPVATPAVFYFLGAFLIFIAAWQLLGFILSINLKSKFSRRDYRRESSAANQAENKISAAADTLELLPSANTKNFASPSATENTTRELIKESRK
jgi:hypothetical protein